jgi:hypothetical protein
MRTVFLVAGALIVAGLIVQPVLNRLRPRYSEPLHLARRLLVQAVITLAFGWSAFELARAGGTLFLGLAALCAILAVSAVLIGALLVWGFVQQPSGENE